MTAPRHTADLAQVRKLLLSWIERQTDEDEADWLKSRKREIEEGAPAWKFFTFFLGEQPPDPGPPAEAVERGRSGARAPRTLLSLGR